MLAFSNDTLYVAISNELYSICNGRCEKLRIGALSKIHAIAARGDKIALLNDAKDFIVLCKQSIVFQSKLSKKASVLKWVSDNSVVVADKFGDVFRINIDKAVNEAVKLLMGHVSMVLDCCQSPDGRFLITSDRDEKIRVSHFPRCFEIASFCLGHEDIVTAVAVLESEEPMIVSAGADGTLKWWNFEGVSLGSMSLCEDGGVGSDVAENTITVQGKRIVKKLVCCDANTVIVHFENEMHLTVVCFDKGQCRLQPCIQFGQTVLDVQLDAVTQNMYVLLNTLPISLVCMSPCSQARPSTPFDQSSICAVSVFDEMKLDALAEEEFVLLKHLRKESISEKRQMKEDYLTEKRMKVKVTEE